MPLGHDHLPGRHWDTSNLRNLATHAGIRNPLTGEPLSEAMCLGIAGGINAGYSFCPSVPGHGYQCGSGVSIAGRALPYVTDASYVQGFFNRLGAKTEVKETGGAKGAQAHAAEALAAGRMPFVWCGRHQLPWQGATAGWLDFAMYSLVVHDIDEGRKQATVADHSATPYPITLDELAKARGQVCSHKNRSLTIASAPKKMTADAFREAANGGIRAGVNAMLKPRMKTFSLEGLAEWSKVIDNPKNAKGWPKVYPGGRVFLALMDVYDSIETTGTGGGLFRAMFADSLDEAAKVTKNKGLAPCAQEYRALAQAWTRFAEAALPDAAKPFKQAKTLLRQRQAALEEKGAAGVKEREKATAQLNALTAKTVEDFPLDERQTGEHLTAMSAEITRLVEMERKALANLDAASK